MKTKKRIGIVGLGNVGKGAAAALMNLQKAMDRVPDMEMVAIFTRRPPDEVEAPEGIPVIPYDEMSEYQGKIDGMILCGGSKTDLFTHGPEIASMFNTVDSFDTHNRVPEYCAYVDDAATEAGTVAIVATGWDPGVYTLFRALIFAIFPDAYVKIFYGPGVSQGHSEAIRGIEGVKDARQYTVPKEEILERVRKGETPELGKYDLHLRDCYVVLEEGADPAEIEEKIRTMPDYFAEQEVEVHFISEEEMEKEHMEMRHQGHGIANVTTGDGNHHMISLELVLKSNPEFTGAIMAAFIRAAIKMNEEGDKGAKTVLDVPLGKLLPMGKSATLWSGLI